MLKNHKAVLRISGGTGVLLKATVRQPQDHRE